MSEFIRINRSSVASSSTRTTYDAGLRAYMLQVYNLMGIALAITGFVSLFVASSPALIQGIYGTPLKWLVLFSPIAFALIFSMAINNISASAAKIYLFIFACLMGLSLAPFFLVYTGASIARAFFITAILFGSMSIYGYTTKKDLTSMGSFFIMGVIGIFIASIVNIFLHSTGLQFVISILAVIIFTGLTAYDSQRIKSIYYQTSGSESVSKAATVGALSLYMNFINIFVSLLQLFGDRR